MSRAPHWKRSVRSLVLPSLLLGLATGCDAGGELTEEPVSPLSTHQAALSTAPTEVILDAVADAYVTTNMPGANFGTSSSMTIDRGIAEVYVRFNLASIPAGARIASVMLQAVAYDGWAYNGDGSVYTYLVTDDTWSETGLNWYTRPAASTERLGGWWLWYGGTAKLQYGANWSPKLMAPVQEALDSDGLISFRLASPGYKTLYRSREHGIPDERPKLIVRYFPPAAPAVLEPEADAYIDTANALTNFGTSETLTLDKGDRSAYLRFNLGGIPSGAAVSSVSLQAVGYSGSNLIDDWSVYTYLVSNDAWSETGITWHNRPEDAPSQSFVAEPGQSDLGSWWLEFAPNKPLNQLGLNAHQRLSAPVQRALDSDKLISFRLNSVGALGHYRSREYPDAAMRPKLTVHYAYPPVPATLQVAVLSTEADAHVMSASPGTNHGTGATLIVDRGLSETFLRFNLASIPATARIAAVSLVTTSHGGYAYGNDGSVYTHLVPNDTWSETGITWNNKPAISGSNLGAWWLWNGNGKYGIQMGINSNPLLVDPVKQAHQTDGLISFRLNSPGYLTHYYSRESSNTEIHWPTLLVYYFMPATTP
ncbi:DUF7594 domain-containing protein [Hyalangium rubrum]|uniref:DNRLRE domain-containing protein n=1 Tax=Hyalangium rubrum TaxID=3103134 RepID=A0ABU5H7S8_9BACT|nr:DNRLRE domain-containing protein [Hyalangium sp. s54d21]MDY7229395.1 DNRLRE domain-containing protein [Hyalangium sp. s54d21]